MKTSLTGTVVGVDVTGTEKIWNCFQAIGNIAFAYTYSSILVEIQVINSIYYISADSAHLNPGKRS